MPRPYSRAPTAPEIAAAADAEIDFSDAPERDEAFWQNARLVETDPTRSVTSRVTRPVLAAFRRLLAAFLLLFPALAAAQACDAPAAGEDGWPVATLAEAGFDADILCPVVVRFEAWRGADVHAIVVIRHGKLVFEHYFTGDDERYGQPAPHTVFAVTSLHDVRSVTKSVTSLLLGIAIGHGWVADIDRPVLPYFPQYADLRTPQKDLITLRHLLTMSQGLAWNENTPYSDPDNSEIRMSRAADPYRFALEQPVQAPPGQVYNYSGGSAALIGAILRKATGRDLAELARDELFGPLGITTADWYRLRNGDPTAASGLRLRPRDMAKLGQLVLDHGQWQGRQVVPAAYVDAAITPQINGSGVYFYGYQFWLGRSFVAGRALDWAAAWGLGGQRIFIVPALDLVTVVTAGLYNDDLQSFVPNMILNRFVLRAAAP